jgi:hypothetical protein
MLEGLIAATVLIVAWEVWLVNKRVIPSWVLAIGPVVIASTVVLALLGSHQLHHAYDVAGDTDPAERNATLAAGVAGALHTLAAGFIAPVLAALALGYYTVTARSRSRSS